MRIPKEASRRDLMPIPGKSQEGVEYKWNARGRTFRVRNHDPDPGVMPTVAVPDPNARVGWVVRVSLGKRYMDPLGRLQPASRVRPGSPHFDEIIANETHIPVTPPASYP
jgi:hypothetical protein